MIDAMGVIFANAKVNLSLAVCGRRSDGYHDLISLVIPVQLFDKITVDEAGGNRLAVSNCPPILDNTVAKVAAYVARYVNKKFHIKLEKNIPIMSGFGGGSSDAVAVLKFFNDSYGLGLNEVSLRDIALSFGADCPFFVGNRPAIVAGKGEIVSEIGGNFQSGLAGYSILLFKPNFCMSTGVAYAKIAANPSLCLPRDRAIELTDDIVSAICAGKHELPLFNTFSEIIFHEHPELQSLRVRLPCPMMLSGSGSGCFCMYRNEDIEPEVISTIKSHLGNNIFMEKCRPLFGDKMAG